jgi:hypothetical protein
MTSVIIIGIIFVIILIVYNNHKQKQKKRVIGKEIAKELTKGILKSIDSTITEKNSIQDKIDLAFNLNEIKESHKTIIYSKLNSDNWRDYDFDKLIDICKNLVSHENQIISKYGLEIGRKIINQNFWIGMTDEQLKDSTGEPDKIEREILKTKTKEIYIYGNKSSGDYFVLENNLVTKIVDR